jgi:hypothetical protein
MVPYTNKPTDEGSEDDIADAFDEAQRVETQLLRVRVLQSIQNDRGNLVCDVVGTRVVKLLRGSFQATFLD